jgi:GT2 family glycosyltransferase
MDSPLRESPLTVSAIVPVHNGGAPFLACLSRLIAARPAPDEIIVVSNGTTDGSDMAAESSNVRVVRLPHPTGPARARNEGALVARGDLLLFVDADVAVPADIITHVVEPFMRDSSLTAIFGSYDAEPSEPDLISQFRNLLHHYVHQTSREEATTFWAGCGAIRREAFFAAGGFDERHTKPSIEDVELGCRLANAGRRIRLVKALQVKHLKRWTPWSMIRTDALGRAAPWTRLIIRRRRLPDDLNFRVSGKLSVVAAIMLAATTCLAVFDPRWIVATFVASVLLFALNAPFYRFLWQRRDVWFLARAVPWHWVHYLSAAAGSAIGALQQLAELRGRPQQEWRATEEWARAGARRQPMPADTSPLPS